MLCQDVFFVELCLKMTEYFRFLFFGLSENFLLIFYTFFMAVHSKIANISIISHGFVCL